MSVRDRDIDERFRRGSSSPQWGVDRGAGRAIVGENIFRDFEEMRKGMERMFEETIRDIDHVPKD